VSTPTLEPETRYARSGDVFIAYQTFGDGPVDLVTINGFTSHLEHMWEEPRLAALYRRLAGFSRLILVDKRGTGLSDRVPHAELPSLEQRVDDLRAVLDAAGSERAAMLGFWEGGAMAALFAATHPDRTRALVLYASPAAFVRTPEYPWAPSPEDNARILARIESRWGQGDVWLGLAPSLLSDERARRWSARLERLAASPGAALTLWRMNMEVDVGHVLPAVHVPTLVLHRRDDPINPVDASRWIASRIPGARFVELEGRDHLPWVGDAEPLVAEIEEFLTGARDGVGVDRVLATILFVDVVDSTGRAAAMGDARWGGVRDGFYALARRELERLRGREVKTTGDGFLATFDGPARAVRAALAIAAGARDLGLHVRSGVHTGECEMRAGDVGGIAVHIGARVADLAAPGEVLVSSTVKDLVAGSGLAFTDRGTRALRGVPGEWRLWAAAA
jgi:pimeloyl-ACP methyl ester carboxylesterase